MEELLLIAIIAGTIVLLVTRLVRLEVTALFVITALVATGLLTAEEALVGFASPATVTVGAMFMLSAALVRTGVLDRVGTMLHEASEGSTRRLLFWVALATAPFSAFVNNTPIVIMMVPVLLSLAQRLDIAPSRLLIPASYFAILGGTCTLLGTSTNILVDAIYRGAGGPGFGLFDFARLGLIFVAIGVVYVLLTADRLLPDRVALTHLLSARDRTTFVTEVVVSEDFQMLGRPYREVFPANRVRLLQVVREEEVRLAPVDDLRVEVGDTVLLEANASAIHELLHAPGVGYASAVQDDQRVRISSFDQLVAEAVVTPTSTFLNRRLPEIGLNRRFGIKVLAVRRLGRHHQYDLRDMRLRTGDVLLVQGDPRALAALAEGEDVLLIEGVSQSIRYPQKAPLALAILVGTVVVAAFGLLPLSVAALCALGLLLVTNCLSMAEALRAIDTSVLLLLAGTIPLGMAMEKTGLAGHVADQLLALIGALGPAAALSILYLAANILTEFMSNNATAVLLAPIAMSVATAAGVDPRPFLITVAFAGSCSFSTPIGYQTNTIVMGPGGYTFGDFTRIGLPLNLILWAVASILVPLLWPF